MYDVNFKRLALLLLPTFWRQPLLGAIAYAIVSPVSYLHARFTRFRQESNYRLGHNGQVCYLRAVLNDQFDPGERRITLSEEPGRAGGWIVHERGGERSTLLPRRERGEAILANRRGFGGVNAVDFWVNIPLAIRDKVDAARLRAIVNTYKLASKRFSINYI